VARTPHHARLLDFYHPEMQEVLLAAAAAAGAEVRPGVTVVGVAAGTPPEVAVASGGEAADHFRARLVVRADGRNSRVYDLA
jgi:2-polyprenyl-6-methoxyphenol hydroxylase-like FAD-dependent oxidoreductase